MQQVFRTEEWQLPSGLRSVPEGGRLLYSRFSRPNGSEVNPRGQGPRAEADAAHGVHACESRDAGRAPPPGFDSNEPARPAGRSRAAPGSTSS